MHGKLRLQLGAYLRRRRGDLTYAQFAKKLGLSSSTLHRLELGEQNVTLETLETLLTKLNCRISDLFPDA